MDFLKRKLVLTYSAVFLIIIDNIDAGSIVIDDCVEQLETAGYKSSNDGLTNYVERIYSSYLKNHNIEQFQQDIAITEYQKCVEKHWEENGTHEQNFEKYYRCYLLIYTRDLPVKIYTPQEWCKERLAVNLLMEHVSKRESLADVLKLFDDRENFAINLKIKKRLEDITAEKACNDALLADGFIFNNGIDNYAFARKLKKKKLREFTALSKEYVTQQVKNGKRSSRKYVNTRLWCKSFDIEIELYNKGFKDRYHGFPNYENTVQAMYNCDCQQLTDKSKEYCELILDQYTENEETEEKRLFTDPGTSNWCIETVVEESEGEDYEIADIKYPPMAVMNPDVCVDTLHRIGFLSTNDGLMNYAQKTFAKILEKQKTTENTSKIIFNDIRMCQMTQWSKDEMSDTVLENFYSCYLTLYTHSLTENMKTSEKWCEKKYSEEEPGDATTTLISTCTSDLSTDNFNYPSGIDNYAYLLSIDANLSLQDSFKDNTKEYNKYLKEESEKIPYQFEDSNTWCTHFQCDVELLNAGFNNRYDGATNYHRKVVKLFENDCSKLQGKANIYCGDLQLVYEGSDPNAELKPLLENPGTMVWCRQHYPIE